MSSKQRLDVLMFERGLAPSREKARAHVMAGEVIVNGVVVDKPGMPVKSDVEIVLKNKPRFVSRGGEKLKWALDTFQIDVTGRNCADVGASTGGFTDCLLQYGAGHIYAIDVGYGQIAYDLRQNSNVTVLERTNARNLTKLPIPISLVAVDASFISLKLLLPAIRNWLTSQADVVSLIKPQFEAGRNDVGKGGVVRDPEVHRRVIIDILSFAQQLNFQLRGLTTSPIKGPAGNIEFLAWFSQGYQVPNIIEIDTLTQFLPTH